MPRYYCEGWVQITISIDCHEIEVNKDDAYNVILRRIENIFNCAHVDNSDIYIIEADQD